MKKFNQKILHELIEKANYQLLFFIGSEIYFIHPAGKIESTKTQFLAKNERSGETEIINYEEITKIIIDGVIHTISLMNDKNSKRFGWF